MLANFPRLFKVGLTDPGTNLTEVPRVYRSNGG